MEAISLLAQLPPVQSVWSNKTSIASCSKRMHSSFQTASKLTEIIIGAAIEVHFHEMKLTDGVHRLILPGVNR